MTRLAVGTLAALAALFGGAAALASKPAPAPTYRAHTDVAAHAAALGLRVGSTSRLGVPTFVLDEQALNPSDLPGTAPNISEGNSYFPNTDLRILR